MKVVLPSPLADYTAGRREVEAGGATLATRTGTPILPIAHNAGEFWGRYAFRKHAGTVQVVIGPVIETKGRDPLSVTREIEDWIEGEMVKLNPERYAGA